VGRVNSTGPRRSAAQGSPAVRAAGGCVRVLLEVMSTPETTRRSFYLFMINLLAGLVAVAAAIPTAVYLLLRPKSRDAGSWIEITDLSKLRVGEPEEIVYNRKHMDGWRRVEEKTSTWLVRTSENSVVAYNPACTHLGCAYHWETSSAQFECPCHGSVFSIDGKVTAGPAPRPLDRFPSRVEGGAVYINPESPSITAHNPTPPVRSEESA
jgi:menaquinol-cytochrome c reductase iron-sulfur subunit